MNPAYEKGRHDNYELREFKEKGLCEKWILGFQLEISSAFFFFEKELYKSVIVETVLFLSILVPYIIIQVLAGVCFAFVGFWRYAYIVAGCLELLAFLLLFILICVTPLLTDMYHRVSEKTERMLDGEEVNPSSSIRCTGGCLLFIIIYMVTGILEFFIFFPVALICFFCLIIPPLGIAMMLCYSSFVRSWGSFKIVFLRHGYDYFGLLKFFLNPEVIPLYMGIGTGYMCMKRVLRQFPGGGLLSHVVTIVSATRFYHFYKLNECTLPSTQQGSGDTASFMAQPPMDQQYPGQGPVQQQQQPGITYSDPSLKSDF